MKKTLFVLAAACLLLALLRHHEVFTLNHYETGFTSNTISQGGWMNSKERRMDKDYFLTQNNSKQPTIIINWDICNPKVQEGDTLFFNIIENKLEGNLFQPLSKTGKAFVQGNFEYDFYQQLSNHTIELRPNQVPIKFIEFDHDISVDLDYEIKGLCTGQKAEEIMKAKIEEKILEAIQKELKRVA